MSRSDVLALTLLAVTGASGCAQLLGDPFSDKRPLEQHGTSRDASTDATTTPEPVPTHPNTDATTTPEPVPTHPGSDPAPPPKHPSDASMDLVPPHRVPEASTDATNRGLRDTSTDTKPPPGPGLGDARVVEPIGSELSTPDSGGAGREPPLYLAITHMDLGEGESQPLGFDLDQGTTCQGRDDAGVYPWGSTGVDNQVGALARDFVQRGGNSTSDALNALLPLGSNTVIYRILGYNRQPDDDEVLIETLGGIFNKEANPGRKAPAWDGTDIYAVEDSSLVAVPDGGYRAVARVSGKVTGYTLRIPLSSAFELVTMDATLTSMNDTWALAGVGGEVLSVQQYAEQLEIGSSCIVNVSASASADLQRKLCAARDVNHAGVSGPCDSFSMGFRFEAHQVQLGGIVPTTTCGYAPFKCPD